MIHKINNSNIYISVDSFGAELRSVCDVHGEEYLLQDRSCWGAQAPILFPIVGKPKDGKYKIEGKTYEIGNHGFARECNFKVLEKRSDAISFSLRESAETLEKYPFKFELQVSFELEGESLCQRFKVKNLDEKPMPFALGGHPGFIVPREEDEKYEDYVIKFDMIENCDSCILEANLTSEPPRRIPVLDNTDTFRLDREIFKNGVLILEKLKSRGLEFYSTISGKGIRIDFDSFDNLGLWSWGGKDYICIEPWSSPGTYCDISGELSKRKGMRTLKPNEIAEYSYKITII